MSNWDKVILGDYISIKGGFSYKGEFIGKGSSLLLGMGCVSYDQKFLNSGARAYSGECSESFLATTGDIVVATRQQSDNLPILGFPAVIPPALSGKTIIVGTNLYKVTNNSNIENNFLYWLLKSPSYRKHILACSKGTTVRMITKDAIETFEFHCPPPEERTAIAALLDALDDKINLLYNNNKTIEAVAEVLFRQWFVEDADVSWNTLTVGDVAGINQRSRSKEYPYSNIEYLDTGSITEGNVSGYQTLPIEEAPSRAQRVVQHNDIVYSVVRPIQRHYGLLSNVKPNMVVSTGFCVITANKISPHFLYILLKNNDTVEYLDMLAEASTSTYPSLKPSDISNLQFQMPPQSVLDKFDNVVKPMWEKITSNERQLLTLIQLRNFLLPKLMDGTLKLNQLVEA